MAVKMMCVCVCVCVCLVIMEYLWLWVVGWPTFICHWDVFMSLVTLGRASSHICVVCRCAVIWQHLRCEHCAYERCSTNRADLGWPCLPWRRLTGIVVCQSTVTDRNGTVLLLVEFKSRDECKTLTLCSSVASGWVSDLRSLGRWFESQPPRWRVQPWPSC